MKCDYHCELAIIGGGIVGAATALELKTRHPDLKVSLFEKEAEPAKHQTGRNSGVIHAGIYYKPGSKKAEFCRQGNAATRAFCDEHTIPYEICGKLLVATDELETERLTALYDRTAANAVERHWVDQSELREREPKVKGLAGVFVPSSGIVNYAQITERMLGRFEEMGGSVFYSHSLVDVEDCTLVFGNNTRCEFDRVVVCGGIQSDRLVRAFGGTPEFVMAPFRGEYYQLPPELNSLVNHLIYPIPDPSMPFLGVHLTRMIDGSVTVGPNAVLAMGREAYKRTDFHVKEAFETLTSPGVIPLLRKHLKAGAKELRNSVWRQGYLKEVQKYCPSIKLDDLRPYPSGIRAQAVSRDGNMIEDFLFVDTEKALIVANAPSPAATSSIPISKHIADKVESWF